MKDPIIYTSGTGTLCSIRLVQFPDSVPQRHFDIDETDFLVTSQVDLFFRVEAQVSGPSRLISPDTVSDSGTLNYPHVRSITLPRLSFLVWPLLVLEMSGVVDVPLGRK